MDQNTATRLWKEGAFFIILGVPEGTEFGIDLKSWNTGEKFRGIKMIPAGLHFIFFNSVNKVTEDLAPREGFFHNFKPKEVTVRKWDKQMEALSTEVLTEDEIISLKRNLPALDSFLGPYPYDIHEKWCLLTLHMTDPLWSKLIPETGLVKSALELQSCSDADRPRGTDRQCSSKNVRSCLSEEDFLPVLKPVKGTQLRLTEFPERKYPQGATPQEITQHSLDSTYVFEMLLSQYETPSGLLGEMEFTYICFLVGHSLEAFEQWKKIVTLFCTSDLAITKYRQIYDDFITILELHIKEIPEEFLADIVSNNNFVYVNLKKLFRNVENSEIDGALKSKISRFKNVLISNFMWDFDQLDSEEEDELPVIVKLP